MEINTEDLLILIDAAYALCRCFDKNGGYSDMGCKYTRKAIIETMEKVSKVIGKVPIKVG